MNLAMYLFFFQEIVGKNLLFLEERVQDTGRILYRNAMNVNIRNSFRRGARKT
jgi:hypothetical protein